MLLNPLTFHAPKSLDEAITLHKTLEENKILAGGTFLLNSLKLLKKKGTKTAKNIISLSKIPELKGISADNDKMVIKSMTIINDIFESPLLTDNFAVLKTVCRNISTEPIRNMATIGGNLTCRYTWTEMPAVMVGLEGQMHFKGEGGQEETVAAEEFFKNQARTDKIFTGVTIKRDKKAHVVYRRIKKTAYVDIPLLSILIKTHFEGKKFKNTIVAVNNCVAFAQRDKILEEFLNKSECSPTIAQEALDHLDNTIYDNRSDDYKKHAFRVSIKSAIEELVTRQKGSK